MLSASMIGICALVSISGLGTREGGRRDGFGRYIISSRGWEEYILVRYQRHSLSISVTMSTKHGQFLKAEGQATKG